MLEKIVQLINSSDIHGLKTLLKKKGAKRYIHRQLILRLLVASLATSIILAVFVFLIEYSRLGSLLNDRAAEVVSNFNDQIQQLDLSLYADQAEIGQELKMLLIAGKSRPWAGQLRYASIYDREGRQIATEFDVTYPDADRVVELAKSFAPQLRGAPAADQAVERIKGTPFLHLRYPLFDQVGSQSGYIAGVFEVSERARKEVIDRIARSVFGAFSTVLLTTLILYPVISRLINRLTVLTGNLVESNIETLRIIGSAIAKRDSETDSHNYRVTIYAVKLAEQIGLKPELIQGLVKGAFLHDVGKIGISDQILLKPGKLTGEEYETMKLHVQHGIDILQQSEWLKDALDVVRCHHEQYAGGGYPAGLKGPEIPVRARIFAIADVFDALNSDRPYKQSLSFEESLKLLNEGRDLHFDPALLDNFNKIAKPLYEQFAHGSDQDLYRKMESIVLKYFSKELRYEEEKPLPHKGLQTRL